MDDRPVTIGTCGSQDRFALGVVSVRRHPAKRSCCVEFVHAAAARCVTCAGAAVRQLVGPRLGRGRTLPDRTRPRRVARRVVRRRRLGQGRRPRARASSLGRRQGPPSPRTRNDREAEEETTSRRAGNSSHSGSTRLTRR